MDLQEHLEGLVSTANEIMLAIESKEEAAASGLSLKFRRQRLALLREKNTWDYRENKQVQLVVPERTKELAVVVDSFEDELAAWRTRPVSDSYFDDADQAAILVDGFLPAAWDFRRDVAILIGTGLEKFAYALREAGQQRILVYKGVETTQEAFPAGTLFAEEVVQAGQLVQYMASPIARLAVSKQRSRKIPLSEHREVMEAANTGVLYANTNRNTTHLHGARWVTQGLTNLGTLMNTPSIEVLDNCFEGMPFVLVAPGPSLSKNIDKLKELQGHAIIAAFSHSLPPLHKAGIHVDFVFVVDSMDVRYHFEGSDPSKVGALISTPMVEPGVFDMGFTQNFLFSSTLALEGWLFEGMESAVELNLGGSAATAAMQAALRWKCDPVICVGLDLSFPGGRTYCEGSSDEDQRFELDKDSSSLRIENLSEGWLELREGKEMEKELCHFLPALGGGVVPTNGAMFKYFLWFGNTAKGNKDNARILNCTEGGCVIPNMEHIPLSEAILECKDRDIDVAAIMAEALSNFDKDAQVKGLTKRTVQRKRELSDVVRISKQCKNLLGARPEHPSRKYIKCEKSLRRAVKKVSFLSLMSDGRTETLGYDAPTEMEQNWYASRHLMESIYNGAFEALQALDGALESISVESDEGAKSNGV
ncbi:MAG: motility associated factor glycosyltransferase family protein [Kofleriaceae bacterium]|nr:motility associated factor glycosyltransferase family protein [Kofleriaceae bacterium]